MAALTITSDSGPSASTVPRSTSAEPSGSILIPVSRPDAGGRNSSMTVRLLANHFLARFNPSQKIFHYDLDITLLDPSPQAGRAQKKKILRVSNAEAREIKEKLFAENREAFRNAMPVFDGKRNVYSPVPLPEQPFTVKLSKVKEYSVALRFAKCLDGRRLAEFLNRANPNHVSVQQEFIQALDLILREHPGATRIIAGRSLYSEQPEQDADLGGGVVASRGFFQSLRPTSQGLALNVDFSVVAFHKPIPVLDYLSENCSIVFKNDRKLSQKERNDAENALRDLEIRVIHRVTSEKFRVKRLTKQITRDIKFKTSDVDNNGRKRMVRIVDYFKQRYDHVIIHELLPCLDLSETKERKNYVPMEFCEIYRGQRYSRDNLTGLQTKKIRRIACLPVSQRMQKINDVMTRPDGPRGGPFASQFQITVDSHMTRVMGRVLGAPHLKLGDGGRVRQITSWPNDRHWNLFGSHVFDGKRIDEWGLINFGPDNESRQNQGESVVNFGRVLVRRCREIGIYMSENPAVRVFDQMRKFSNVAELRRTLMDVHTQARGHLQILICLMKERNAVGYRNLKLICETEIGLITQCCLWEHAKRCLDDQRSGSQYLLSLALKINAKVGGSNAALLHGLSHQFPRFGDSQVIYFGADVNHPGSRDDNSPSIAAVVASINWPWCNRYVTKIRSQKNRQEHIQELGEMSKELLDEYLKVNHNLPQKILFFRDGVSDCQFDKVLNRELVALKESFKQFRDYNPAISFIVAQKRHHTRLFPCSGERCTTSGNVPPGTVVDTVIVHPREFDFYLCSHYGFLGTTKPTRYHVLWDDNQFTSDELQTLINNLCYTFARCTKPVSLVPPVSYAHLAAYRGRLYAERVSQLPPSSDGASRSGFPNLHDGVKNFMFFC